jgi:hypothetical protein
MDKADWLGWLVGLALLYGLIDFLDIQDAPALNSIYEKVQIIQEVPFDHLESGILYNNGEILVKKNLNYPYDKVVETKIEGDIYDFEVENDNGQSKVVTVSLNGKEVVFQ